MLKIVTFYAIHSSTRITDGIIILVRDAIIFPVSIRIKCKLQEITDLADPLLVAVHTNAFYNSFFSTGDQLHKSMKIKVCSLSDNTSKPNIVCNMFPFHLGTEKLQANVYLIAVNRHASDNSFACSIVHLFLFTSLQSQKFLL